MSDDRRGGEMPEVPEEPSQRWPVGFVLLIVAAALYLGYRAFQLVELLIRWLR